MAKPKSESVSGAADIRAFIAANPPRCLSRCWVCLLPNVEAINEVARDGVPASALIRYLLSTGIDARQATRSRMVYHLIQRHHLSQIQPTK